jgi:hypothetical protein
VTDRTAFQPGEPLRPRGQRLDEVRERFGGVKALIAEVVTEPNDATRRFPSNAPN